MILFCMSLREKCRCNEGDKCTNKKYGQYENNTQDLPEKGAGHTAFVRMVQQNNRKDKDTNQIGSHKFQQEKNIFTTRLKCQLYGS